MWVQRQAACRFSEQFSWHSAAAIVHPAQQKQLGQNITVPAHNLWYFLGFISVSGAAVTAYGQDRFLVYRVAICVQSVNISILKFLLVHALQHKSSVYPVSVIQLFARC